MTLHIIAPPNSDEHVSITAMDAKYVDVAVEINVVHVDLDPYSQIKQLASLELKAGDIICLAGACPRQTTAPMAEIAATKKVNLMPGTGVDHRGVPIGTHKINSRAPIEKNNMTAWPYVMVVGDPELATKSFKLLPDLDPALYWANYVPAPNDLKIEHLLAILPATGLWESPDWFKVVDLSIRNLELAPVMYASHMWHDWIAFYPANGNFKLENHSQLCPVWLAGSTKPLEYWKQ
jgi:hypothetical protein